MKKTAAKLDNIRYITEEIRKSLQEMEVVFTKTSGILAHLHEDAAELSTVTDAGPSYVNERSKRLQDLLKTYEERTTKVGETYNALYRQIEKIDDTLISDFFSPVIDAGVRDILREGRPATPQPDGNLMVYRLGDLFFAVKGRILKEIPSVPASSARKYSYKGYNVEPFPHYSERAFFPEKRERSSLLIVENPESYRPDGFYFDEIIEYVEMSEDRLFNNMEGLRIKHRRVKGRLRIKGRLVYVIA